MNPDDALDGLVATLGGADPEAAERAYLAFEPHLRMLVRRRLSPQLRARFDSVDVVQSVWADLLDGLRSNRWQFADAAHLRGFLVRATSNRLIDRARQHRSAMDRERDRAVVEPGQAAGASRGAAATVSEVAQAEELWDRMLAVCPPEHREILQLRRQGLTTAEIGDRVGRNDGSVRRILGELARRLAVSTGGEDRANPR